MVGLEQPPEVAQANEDGVRAVDLPSTTSKATITSRDGQLQRVEELHFLPDKYRHHFHRESDSPEEGLAVDAARKARSAYLVGLTNSYLKYLSTSSKTNVRLWRDSSSHLSNDIESINPLNRPT